MENNIKILRTQKGLTGRQLAEQIGVGAETISKYERGALDITSMKIGTLLKICDVLDCNLSEIVGSSHRISSKANSYGKVHFLKLNIEFCDDVLNGKKNFEIRNNDRGFQTGDLIKFIPTDGTYSVDLNGNETQLARHPISERIYKIKYILSGWGLKNGYVALAIEEVSKDE
ncbi:MAG: DUF3850 domain-containing protein [Ruminococcus sp.]|nr:DUF3850 domain-containing protein [Ruminococcus sp.]